MPTGWDPRGGPCQLDGLARWTRANRTGPRVVYSCQPDGTHVVDPCHLDGTCMVDPCQLDRIRVVDPCQLYPSRQRGGGVRGWVRQMKGTQKYKLHL